MAELPTRKRIFYGMGGVTMNLPDLLVMQWLVVRYAPPDARHHLVPAALFGALVLGGRITEGICAPVIAHWSDGCESRWGRRLPFIRFGLGPFALVFFLLFSPPIAHLHWLNAVHAFVTIELYFFLYGVIITPYLSLLPEITSDLKERVDLTTFQSVFMLVATFVFASMGMILEHWGWATLAACATVLIVLFFLPVATRIQEKPRARHADQEKLNLFRSIRLTLANRPFRFVIAATACYWFGLNGTIVLVPHWVLSFLGGTEGDVTLLMVPFLGVNLVFFFVFNALARVWGKYVMMLVTFLGSAIAMASLALVGHLPVGSDFVQSAVVFGLFGAPAAGFMVLPFAILANVIDHDETLTGRRREAIFFGVQGIAQKAMIGLSVLAFTIVPYIGSDGAQRLRQGASLTFSGVYQPADGAAADAPTEPDIDEMAPGTIRVDAAPDALEAPWTLNGPDGFVRHGKGDALLADLSPGSYAITWGAVSGWTTPEPTPTASAFGLKLMALLCALTAAIAFLLFLRYPIRERDGAIVLVR